MTTTPRYVPAYPHDPLVEIFPHVFLLRGSIRIGFGLRMNRNMVVIQQGHDLILINAVRLNERGLYQLNQLGTVKHVIRLGDFHGMDDQFYLDTYNAHFWSQANHKNYQHLSPMTTLNKAASLPINDATFFNFETAKYPEAAILITPAKLLITTDSVQYWADWKYTSVLSKFILRLMGFKLGLFIGAPWLKRVTPKDHSLKSDFDQLLQLDFKHLVAAHGTLLKHEAKTQLQRAVQNTFANNKKVS